MKEIMVTGGAGFIGSNLCEELLARDYRVVCVDNMDNYYSPLRKEINLKGLIGREGFTFIKGDIRDRDFMSSVFSDRQIGYIAHLAARAGVRASIADPLLYTDVNVNGTMSLLEMARLYGVERFVFISSSSVYGKVGGDQSFNEELDADHPASPYGASKRAGELICYAHHQIYKIPTAVLRLFTVYGPRQRPEMAIHKFTRLINENREVPVYGDGSSLRDYTFVDDIIKGIVGALFDDRGFEIYNLGNSRPVKLLDVVKTIENYLDKEARIRWLPDQAGDVPRTFANNQKAISHLGFSPEINIEEGIKMFIKWYLEDSRSQVQEIDSIRGVSC